MLANHILDNQLNHPQNPLQAGPDTTKNFSVELLQHSGTVQLNIGDDGVGFDIETTFQSVISGNSLGLAGMRERVELVGGAIEFLSQPGEGTEIRMSFPISSVNEESGDRELED